MSLRSRSRWIAAATAIAIPALALVTACNSDKAASPKALATADTVALDENNVNVLEWWVSTEEGDSGYYSFNGAGDGNYVETDSEGGNYTDNYRILMQYALPKLEGKGVVDSARMFAYACSHASAFTDSVIVDHVNYGAVFQDSASWGSQVLQANVGTLVRDTTPGWKSVDVSSAVQADYAAKRANSQYRLEWAFAAMPTGQQWVEFAGSYCNNNGNSNGGAGQGYMVIWAH